MMADLIDRQAAIGTVKHMREVCDTDDINDYYDLMLEAFNVLPSAQQEVAKNTNVPINDCVSRQVMFEMVAEYEKQLREIYGDENELVETVKILKHRLLIELPSVQPEPSQVARDIATIIENEMDMRVMLSQPEIVRCKDCKNSRFFDPCFYCYEFSGEIIVPENGFCFMAERRTDE